MQDKRNRPAESQGENDDQEGDEKRIAEPGCNPTSPVMWLPLPLIAAVAIIAKVEALPRLIDIRFVTICVPVVKLQTKLVASALFARSLTPVVIVFVYVVLGARLLSGVKVAVRLAAT